MRITLNDKSVELKESISLVQLFDRFNIQATTGMAVAVNEMVIPKKEWPLHAVSENDKILIITATQGG